MTPRPEIRINGQRFVIVEETAHRLVLERLTGGFADYRKRLGLTQEEMAHLLNISQTYISLMESGERAVPTEIKERCAELVKRAAKSRDHLHAVGI